ncbi:MAG: LytTR family DNA-binding domain-containing protein [Gemmatimonadaceae bacterium]|jgi:DNA-binding LytR/AlgR family response regulator|nr:LytTR family DNA-binding domain-containing protein [Gemmatimonadaceae bacterium]
MTMLRVAIVDDEPLSRRALRQLLDARADVRVVAECASGAEVLAMRTAVDVLFLDIEMPGASGLAVADALRGDATPRIVFVTAYAEHAVSAFDLDAVDYLTKPVEESRLSRAIDRVHAAVGVRSSDVAPASDVDAVAHLLARVGTRDVVIPIRDIVAIEADGVYAAVHAGRRYLIRQPMHRLEAQLGRAFLRVHRSWLVRRTAIAALRRPRGARAPLVELAGGLVVPIGRRRVAQIRGVLSGAAVG